MPAAAQVHALQRKGAQGDEVDEPVTNLRGDAVDPQLQGARIPGASRIGHAFELGSKGKRARGLHDSADRHLDFHEWPLCLALL